MQDQLGLNDPEVWKPIIGYNNRYEVSSHGRVRALFYANHGQHKPGRIITALTASNGYLKVGLYDVNVKCRQRSIHSLVLEAFVGPRPNGYVVRHMDRIRSHNTPDNLKWGTSEQNAQDALGHGTFVIGEKNGQSKLVAGDVLKIRAMRDSGIACKTIAEMFNVDWSNVWLIGKRKSWKHLPEA